ncbi:MAG TPA: LptF/LptG family permease [Vicinamibacterales bacterium]|nr:LptF/LptG family permease [Vicinamibacterales bacterium]
MLRTLDRYVIREVLPPFLLALLIFTFILELPPIMRQLETLVAKGVPWRAAAEIIVLLAPQALGLTIPMGLLVGLLIGLGRMSSDREGVALLACGVSPYRLLRPVMLLAALAMAATMWVMIVAIPDANQRFRVITWDIITKKVETDIKPRIFFEDFPHWVLYPRDEADPGQPGWKDVMAADTSRPGTTDLFLARRGRLVLDREKRQVDLVLTDGTRYRTSGQGETDTSVFPGDLVLKLNPDDVFRPMELPRGVSEKTIAQLRETIAEKVAGGRDSPHPEIMAIHAKFSIPVACLVFAVIGLALGLTVARDGKLAGFVVGIAVIFAYYVAMFLAESMAKGQILPAALARWIPNLILGPFGVAALIWRARFADARLPFRVPIRIPSLSSWRPSRAIEAAPATPVASGPAAAPAARTAAPRGGVVLVIRVPRLSAPRPGLLDRYIARLYLRVVALSFLALLGLFYISTFIDKSDKIFKGQATTGTVVSFMLYSTPQFIYYIVPIAALLSVLVTFGVLTRSSELTVMKACGVSLYRAAVPVLLLSLLFSGVLYSLDQQIMARANRQAEILDAQIRGRQARTFSTLIRRWVIGRDGAIYHYGFFDPGRREIISLAIYEPEPRAWRLESQTFVRRAAYAGSGWTGFEGWVQDFRQMPPKWQPMPEGPLPDLEPPEYFATEQPVAEMMTVPQLRDYVAELAASGFNVVPLAVELQRRTAFPFVTVVMALLAVPFGVSTGKRGTLYGIGLGIVIALTYWVASSAFVAIGSGGLLPPVLAGWAPNIMTLSLAAYLVLRVRT